MSKAVSDIPFDKIYVGMKIKCPASNNLYYYGKVIFVKDNKSKNIIIEWESNTISLHSYCDNILKYYTFAE
jgi:hypothetical protein